MASIESIHFRRTRRVARPGRTEEPWETEDIKVKLHGKQGALNTLSKHFQMIDEKPEPQVSFVQMMIQRYGTANPEVTPERLALANRVLPGEELDEPDSEPDPDPDSGALASTRGFDIDTIDGEFRE